MVNSTSGYVLCSWADFFSQWRGIAHSDDRAKVEAFAETLSCFGLDLYIFPCSSIATDADICEAMDRHRPPKTAFVAHWPDDPNA